MGVFLNFVGIFLTLGSAILVLRSFMKWKGNMRGGIFLFAVGFSLFAFGFISRLFVFVPNLDMIFLSLGAAFLLFGSRKVFTYDQTV